VICTLHQVEEDEAGGTCSANGGEEKRVEITPERSEGKRSLGRPRH
jgi:hypothetical protein